MPATVIAAGSATHHAELVYNDATNGDSNVVTVGPFTTASAISFSGTIPAQTVTSGAVVDLDLSSYWAGTGFGSLAWSSIGASIAGASSGLSLNTATGHITGTAGAAQTISGVQLRKSDSGLAVSSADSGTFTITISGGSTPVSFAGTVPGQVGTIGSAFSLALAGYFSGSLTPFTYSVLSGSLPAGLSLNTSTGAITGTPTTAGSSSAVIRATDTGTNTAQTGSIGFTISASAPSGGTFTSEPLKRNNGTLAAGSALDYVRWYNPTTGALVLSKTGLSTNGSGVFSTTDAALSGATSYALDWKESTGERRMPIKATA